MHYSILECILRYGFCMTQASDAKTLEYYQTQFVNIALACMEEWGGCSFPRQGDYRALT